MKHTANNTPFRSTSLAIIAAIDQYHSIYHQTNCPLPKQRVVVHTNNSIIIKRLNRHYRNITLASKQFEQEHESITSLHNILATNNNIQLNLICKSDTSETSLVHQEKLQYCYNHATNSVKMFSKEVDMAVHTSIATVYINSVEVATNTPNEMRYAALSPNLRAFFQIKCKWTNSIIDLIDWEVGSALQSDSTTTTTQ